MTDTRTTRKPATPLPWEATRVSDPSGQNWIAYELGQARNLASKRIARTVGWNESPDGADAAYIAHAANAYPRLIAALRDAAMAMDYAEIVLHSRFASPDTADGRSATSAMNRVRASYAPARKLLADLGE